MRGDLRYIHQQETSMYSLPNLHSQQLVANLDLSVPLPIIWSKSLPSSHFINKCTSVSRSRGLPFFFYWRLVAWQCCVGSCYAQSTEQSSPCSQQASVVTCFMRGIHSVCVSTPVSQFIHPSPPVLSALVFVSMSVSLFLFANRFTCTVFLDSIYMRYSTIFFSFWLTSLCVMVSRSIHFSAKTQFHSFLWMSHTPWDICATSS